MDDILADDLKAGGYNFHKNKNTKLFAVKNFYHLILSSISWSFINNILCDWYSQRKKALFSAILEALQKCKEQEFHWKVISCVTLSFVSAITFYELVFAYLTLVLCERFCYHYTWIYVVLEYSSMQL